MPQREVIEFPANTPVELSLQYSTAKLFSNEHGDRAMFSLTNNRVMFLDLEVAKQIEAASLQAKERFTLTRKENGSREKSTWEIARAAPPSQPGEQPNGTYVVPAVPESPKPMGRASSLVTEANALVDAYAEVLERTLTTYQGRVKPEEARALLITAYIQRSKLSSVA